MILVVGATGQLGTAITRKLSAAGQATRALVRHTSKYEHLQQLPCVELAFGDLRDRPSLDAACEGVETVIATANTAMPSQTGDSIKAVDYQGYDSLIRAARKQGVSHFIYTSVPAGGKNEMIPLSRAKRDIEAALMSSGMKYTVFRPAAFMDVYFALMGSDIPARGAQAATVHRPFSFSARFYRMVKDNVNNGKIGIVGKGNVPQSYICVDDAAEFHVRAVGNPKAFNQFFDLGGPEALTPLEVKAIYEKVLGRPLAASYTPAMIFRLGMLLLRPFAPAVANIMALNYVGATEPTVIDSSKIVQMFGVNLTSAEDFLRQKALLN